MYKRQVYSLKKITPDFIEKQAIEEVVISIQSIEPARLLEISSILFELGLKVKIVPPVQTWIDGDLSVGQIKDVKIEDLLGREPISIINPALVHEYENQIIFITGAAGSIGSEIVRQVAEYKPKMLLVLDQAESPLHQIQLEINEHFPNLKYKCIICDVTNNVRLQSVFDEFDIDVIYHAAAYKHVPLMENNPHEAILTNILGTKQVADLAAKFKVGHFVMVSTDKAVNPSNVMGASKRASEMYVQSLNYNLQLKDRCATKFITTRFGNVLGSNGSVVPLFKRQIEEGGPVTITHPDIIRYFMTIPEACQLVLEAGAMGKGCLLYTSPSPRD